MGESRCLLAHLGRLWGQQEALEVYQLEVLPHCLQNLLNIFQYISSINISQYISCINIFQYISSNIVHGQAHVTVCPTCLLNNKSCNTCFLTICFYRLSVNRFRNFISHKIIKFDHKHSYWMNPKIISSLKYVLID